MSATTKKTVSQKMSDLSTLVTWFESDEFVIEQAVEKYKEAEKLARDIERDLESLKNEVTVLKQKFDA